MCLEESLYIHNIRDMKVLHTIRETPPNPAGERAAGGRRFSDPPPPPAGGSRGRGAGFSPEVPRQI